MAVFPMRQLRNLEDQASYLEQKKRQKGLPLGVVEAARNTGRRRTPEKRALLQRIDDEARRRGEAPAFAAEY
jgi:hypothetical protein